jgi:L-ascorbate metabolism protein UlaG (beta-lactamase superfamily)
MGRKAFAILLFLWLLLGLYGSAYHSPSVNANQALHDREEPYQIQVALYNGSGAWYGGTLAMNKMFTWMDCSVTTIQIEDILNGVLESKRFDILAWPGGDYLSYWG